MGLIPSETLQQMRESDSRSRGSIRSKSSEVCFHPFHTNGFFIQEELIYESVSPFLPSTDIVRPIVLIGHPGVGRNELKRRLLMLFPERFSSTIPHTTRAPRPGETQGVDYHFVERDFMELMITNGDMLEFGEYRGNSPLN